MPPSGRSWKTAVSAAAAVACISLLVVEKGLGERNAQAGYGLVVVLQTLLLLLPDRRSLSARLLSDGWTTTVLASMAVTAGVSLAAGGGWAVPVIVETAALLVSSGMLLRHAGRLLVRHVPAWAILPVSIAVVMAAGAALLMLPNAVESGHRLTFMDSVFTAASATCVTGLSVIDPGETLSVFGEVVMLLLIQIGGLGLMSFAAFFALFFGQRVGLKESISISKAMDAEFLSSLRSLIMSFMIWTFMIEASGAILLYTTWQSVPAMAGRSGLDLAWLAVFHSVSAFCNAGFGLLPDNIESLSSSPATCFTMGSLIVLGGLGFGTLTAMSARVFSLIRGERGRAAPLQARLASRMTLLLIGGSMALVMASEWSRSSFSGMTAIQKVANSFLMAVTPRTAGFDTVPIRSLSPLVQLVFVALMFIGASPGGTGGGVKTTTIGLLAHGGVSLLRHRPSPEIMHRRIPALDLQRAAVLLAAALGVCIAASAALVASEVGQAASGCRGIFDYVFETVSAFGTVGLSLGVTPELTTTGRWIIIATMFAGRVGPATLAMLTAKPRSLDYSYPEARVGIG
ncbi:Trk family potassium uptake protein [Candidatus Fermentibacteria bacterium]|nr:Trk family potassium uptake protein [Candidatus Fermentibacteria bacterium]